MSAVSPPARALFPPPLAGDPSGIRPSSKISRSNHRRLCRAISISQLELRIPGASNPPNTTGKSWTRKGFRTKMIWWRDMTTGMICGSSGTTTSCRRSSGTKSPESFPSQTKRPAHPVLFRDAPVFHSHSTLTPSQRPGSSRAGHSSHTTPYSQSHLQTVNCLLS